MSIAVSICSGYLRSYLGQSDLEIKSIVDETWTNVAPQGAKTVARDWRVLIAMRDPPLELLTLLRARLEKADAAQFRAIHVKREKAGVLHSATLIQLCG